MRDSIIRLGIRWFRLTAWGHGEVGPWDRRREVLTRHALYR